MTARQYRAAIAQLGLGIAEAGPVFGLSGRQAQRIAAGHSRVPGPLALLIRLMLRLGVAAGDLRIP